MWGYTSNCACGLCSCFPRVLALIRVGNHLPGFVPWICDRVRLIEADLRDELQRRGAPEILTQASAPSIPEGPRREEGGAATTPPPKAEAATPPAAPGLLQLTPRGGLQSL